VELREAIDRLLELAKERLNQTDYTALRNEIKSPIGYLNWNWPIMQGLFLASPFLSPDDVLLDMIDIWVGKRNAPDIPTLPPHKTPPPMPAAAPVSPAVTLPDSMKPPPAPATPPKWQEEARKIADECYVKDTANKSRDSLKGYSERVMKIMQEREIHGPRGRIDNPKTIYREALQGNKWWAKKSP
jgi:hypothetical protein